MLNRSPRRLTARSRHSLALGGIAAAGLSLSSCGTPQAADRQFATVADCTAGGFSQVVCEGEFERAQAAAVATAPKFDSQAACEAEYGAAKCQPTYERGERSGFSPFLTGFLVANALQNITSPRGYYDYRRDNGYASTPIYRNRSGQAVTSVRAPGGVTRVEPVNVNTRTAARSGFGGRGMSRGGGFGG